jgi:hypothetical protein
MGQAWPGSNELGWAGLLALSPAQHITTHHHIKTYRFFGLCEYFFRFVVAPILADVFSFL